MQLKNLPKSELYHHIFAILSYQYSEKFATAFLEPFERMTFKFSRKSGKIKQIMLKGSLQAVYRPPLGTFSLTIHSALRILPAVSAPRFRVKVQSDVSEFIKSGKSVFAKHVIEVDPELRIGDEVLVVDESDQLLAIGKLDLPPIYFPDFKSGSAVRVRKGINSIKTSK